MRELGADGSCPAVAAAPPLWFGTPPAPGTRVRVYRNLRWRPQVVYSIQASGRVVGYAETIALGEVTLVVRRGGQQRARATGHRNVHAFVNGTVLDTPPVGSHGRATYNPHLHDTFVDAETLLPLPERLRAVVLGAGGMFYVA